MTNLTKQQSEGISNEKSDLLNVWPHSGELGKAIFGLDHLIFLLSIWMKYGSIIDNFIRV